MRARVYCFVLGGVLWGQLAWGQTERVKLEMVGEWRPGYTSGRAYAVAVSGSYAYVAEFREGEPGQGHLQVVDISNPTDPQRRGGYDMSGHPTAVEVSGNHAYVVDAKHWYGGGNQHVFGNGLVILDISNPASPQRVGSLTNVHGAVAVSGDGYPLNVAVSGNYGYVADRYAGLVIFKIRELPAITCHSVENGRLNLQWNDPAKGMKLQRTTSLTNPMWQELIGSESTNAVALLLWGGSEFFRLIRP